MSINIMYKQIETIYTSFAFALSNYIIDAPWLLSLHFGIRIYLLYPKTNFCQYFVMLNISPNI